MALRVLLADADGTLFDFHRGEAVAIGENPSGGSAFPTRPATWKSIRASTMSSGSGWSGEETTQERLRVDRFTDFLRETGLEGDPQALCDCYVELLGRQRYILSGAEEFCREVSARIPIYLVTNGISQIQRSRFGDCAITPLSLRYGDQRRGGACQAAPGHAVPGAGDGGLRPAGSDRDGRQRDRRHRRGQRRGGESILFTEGKEPPEGHGATYCGTHLSGGGWISCWPRRNSRVFGRWSREGFLDADFAGRRMKSPWRGRL